MQQPTSTLFITGAAHGFGADLARTLIAPHTQLVLLDNDLNALNALYDELDAQFPNQIFLYPMDLKGAIAADYQQLAETLNQQFGQLDGLYLNAAILPAFTPIEYFEPMQWYEVMQVNLNANFHLLQTLLPLLKKSSKAQVVSIGDQAVQQHPAYYGAYGVAKAGLAQLLKTLSAEQQKSAIDFWQADLPPFQSSLRARLFPGENIEALPQPQQLAKQLIQQLKGERCASDIILSPL